MSSDERAPCRDFERGVCNRGDKCKYYHPEGVSPPENAKLPICKDFQNKGCGRFKCKFLHITLDEEAEYNKTGNLPEHGGRPEKMASNLSFQGKEICKDFLNNICDRGSRCRFLHISERELQMEQANGASMGMLGGMYGKRRRDDFGVVADSSAAMMEENEMLKRKITELQRQVLDLRQMNDTLYDQNTRYRNQLRGNPTIPDANQPADAYKTAYSARVPAAVAPAAATDMMATRPAYDYSQLTY